MAAQHSRTRSPKADPVFALIQAHKAALRKVNRLMRYENNFSFEVNRPPRVQVAYLVNGAGERKPRFLYDESDILPYVDSVYGLYPEAIREQHKKLFIDALSADAEELKKAQDATGFTAAQAAFLGAGREEERVYAALLRAHPRTAGGLAAFALHIADHEKRYHVDGIACAALRSIAKSVRRIGGVT